MKIILSLLLASSWASAQAPLAIPTFTGSFISGGKQYSYTMAGGKPESGGVTTIPVAIVPVTLSFRSKPGVVLSASQNVQEVVHSPLFEPFQFPNGKLQYGDALQRAQFADSAAGSWHTLFAAPKIMPEVSIEVPVANGYLLHSRSTGKSLGIADLEFVQKQLFQQLSKAGIAPDALLIAVTKNVAFYVLGDVTVCCSVGSHGVGAGSPGQPFVIGSYFDQNVMPHFSDLQAISQQIAEWINDPLHNVAPNEFPRWLEPAANVNCGGPGESSAYLLEQPTDYLPNSNSMAVQFKGRNIHLENVALLPWFEQKEASSKNDSSYSFPDRRALTAPAQPCRSRDEHASIAAPTAQPVPRHGSSNAHSLIGYWEGYESAGTKTPLRDVSPQWDIVIATFAAPVKGSTSLLAFEPPAELGEQRFKSDVAYLQSHGRKVLISLGGGGQVVTLNTAEDLHNFVTSVTSIVEKYRFDGVDLDIETPSLLINAGDDDFRHPTTPSVVNLIAAMHQLHDHFGAKFMITEVPEAAQAQAGMQAYGGQFGSFLPVIYGTRDILSFVDAQDYNTPPLEGLDGNYYFPGHADYHVALSEMLLQGFPVGGNSAHLFPPLPPEKVAIGLPATPTSARNYTAVPQVEDALRYLIEGKAFTGGSYKLRRPAAYPKFLGAMFWAINEDRRNGYRMSNVIGPLLHGISPTH